MLWQDGEEKPLQLLVLVLHLKARGDAVARVQERAPLPFLLGALRFSAPPPMPYLAAIIAYTVGVVDWRAWTAREALRLPSGG